MGLPLPSRKYQSPSNANLSRKDRSFKTSLKCKLARKVKTYSTRRLSVSEPKTVPIWIQWIILGLKTTMHTQKNLNISLEDPLILNLARLPKEIHFSIEMSQSHRLRTRLTLRIPHQINIFPLIMKWAGTSLQKEVIIILPAISTNRALECSLNISRLMTLIGPNPNLRIHRSLAVTSWIVCQRRSDKIQAQAHIYTTSWWKIKCVH